MLNVNFPTSKAELENKINKKNKLVLSILEKYL